MSILGFDLRYKETHTSTIADLFLNSGCGRVVWGAGHKANGMVPPCINGVGFNPVEGEQNICQLKN
jgi:hypothetical protein